MDHGELLNYDNPAVRAFEDGSIYIYGTSWSGKKDCYLNQRARLAGITRLVQGPVNEFSQKKRDGCACRPSSKLFGDQVG